VTNNVSCNFNIPRLSISRSYNNYLYSIGNTVLRFSNTTYPVGCTSDFNLKIQTLMCHCYTVYITLKKRNTSRHYIRVAFILLLFNSLHQLYSALKRYKIMWVGNSNSFFFNSYLNALFRNLVFFLISFLTIITYYD